MPTYFLSSTALHTAESGIQRLLALKRDLENLVAPYHKTRLNRRPESQKDKKTLTYNSLTFFLARHCASVRAAETVGMPIPPKTSGFVNRISAAQMLLS